MGVCMPEIRDNGRLRIPGCPFISMNYTGSRKQGPDAGMCQWVRVCVRVCECEVCECVCV